MVNQPTLFGSSMVWLCSLHVLIKDRCIGHGWARRITFVTECRSTKRATSIMISGYMKEGASLRENPE